MHYLVTKLLELPLSLLEMVLLISLQQLLRKDFKNHIFL